MLKQLNWERVEKRAGQMTGSELHYAILDCMKAVEAWHPRNGDDPEGNQGYYMDELSVYRRERQRRMDVT